MMLLLLKFKELILMPRCCFCCSRSCCCSRGCYCGDAADATEDEDILKFSLLTSRVIRGARVSTVLSRNQAVVAEER
jgi:hypothetical protein